MKKWMMIATAFLALSGVSGAALYQQHVSAKSDVKTTTVKTVTKKQQISRKQRASHRHRQAQHQVHLKRPARTSPALP